MTSFNTMGVLGEEKERCAVSAYKPAVITGGSALLPEEHGDRGMVYTHADWRSTKDLPGLQLNSSFVHNFCPARDDSFGPAGVREEQRVA
ncbi:hypothetical protein JZ751_008084 [Albula glossodonta]|uniref:Uncharacterized protein n=1 Tax=Albula glossodonta TaxID=121402 RepID=A0A8T2P1Q0_9TELE|nr:hypothetical protein JZ751_008084 [Albula glossodonta]